MDRLVAHKSLIFITQYYFVKKNKQFIGFFSQQCYQSSVVLGIYDSQCSHHYDIMPSSRARLGDANPNEVNYYNGCKIRYND
jgi:hypothetical protein